MNPTGESISAEDAYEHGLVNRVVADHELFDTALAWARKFAGQAPVALEQIKQVSHGARPRRGHRGREAGLRRRLRLRGRARGHLRVRGEADAAIPGEVTARSRRAGGRAADHLAGLIRSARSVVALTGAGISVPSGIPDFRSPGSGLWANVEPDGGRAHRRLPARPGALLALLRAALRARWTASGPTARTARWPSSSAAACWTPSSRRTSTACTPPRARPTRSRSTARSPPPRASPAAPRYPLGGGPRAAGRRRARASRAATAAQPLKPDVVLFGELLPEAAIAPRAGAAPRAPTCCCASAPRSRSGRSPSCREITLRAGGAVAIVTAGPDAVRRAARRSSSPATWSPSSRRCSPRSDPVDIRAPVGEGRASR